MYGRNTKKTYIAMPIIPLHTVMYITIDAHYLESHTPTQSMLLQANITTFKQRPIRMQCSRFQTDDAEVCKNSFSIIIVTAS